MLIWSHKSQVIATSGSSRSSYVASAFQLLTPPSFCIKEVRWSNVIIACRTRKAMCSTWDVFQLPPAQDHLGHRPSVKLPRKHRLLLSFKNYWLKIVTKEQGHHYGVVVLDKQDLTLQPSRTKLVSWKRSPFLSWQPGLPKLVDRTQSYVCLSHTLSHCTIG